MRIICYNRTTREFDGKPLGECPSRHARVYMHARTGGRTGRKHNATAAYRMGRRIPKNDYDEYCIVSAARA